ncbi:glycosyltransferase family 2 protein [Botryobacter ruber]|uniref:glycosyltransferase family 2 protein n=1 Tax=Botryobacter ruber TaxID=2171629 RepID=UPI000E0A22E1|nr:glycosyltransferase family 2 protein [Botryobacter ruber]
MIYIVIPVFNRLIYTKACLESLQKQTNKQFKVVVVDHGSSDGTSAHIKKYYPDTILLNGDANMWWAAATNLGIKYALNNDAKFILTLNNDTVAEANYLENLLEAVYQAPKDSLIGSSAINSTTKSVVFRGEILNAFNWFTETSQNVVNKNYTPQFGLIELTHYPGRGLLIPMLVFKKIGLFDEVNFPHYMSDYEFTLRARKAGFKIFCAYNALLGVYPEASGANQLKNKKNIKNYYHHLFGMKGGANLPLFYKYALRHCPVYALPSFLLLGTIRRITGYWLKN